MMQKSSCLEVLCTGDVQAPTSLLLGVMGIEIRFSMLV